jgi:hypothetical protein
MAERVHDADQYITPPPTEDMSRSDLVSEEVIPGPDRHRERVAEIVNESDPPMTLDTLTDRVLEHEPELAATPESRSELHERLYLRDLPALERENALTFDIERGLVTNGDRASALAAVETGAAESRRRDVASADAQGDARPYLLATAATVTLFTLAALDVSAFAAVPPTAAAVAAVGVFAALALGDRS